MELELKDVWVWDMYRRSRFVPTVKVLSFKDVNVEELPKEELNLAAGRRATGAWGEEQAARWYEDRGYRCWPATGGSGRASSISSWRGGLVVFCEVKSRSSDASGSPPRPSHPPSRLGCGAWLSDGWPPTAGPGRVVRFDVACVVRGRVAGVIEPAF